MARSQAFKNRSYLQNQHGAAKQRANNRIVAIAALVIITLAALLANNSILGDDRSQQPTLLEALPRSLFAENGEVPSSFGAKAISPGKYPPFDCAKLLDDLNTDEAVQKKDPNMGMLYARRTVTDNSFYISVHNQTFDTTRWDLIVYGFYYERVLTAAFYEVLKSSPPGARILDVGGNIGFFSLVSASAGPFFIDTFEPNLKNRMRYCESLNLNRWTHTEFDAPTLAAQTKPKTNLYPYGVGQEEGTFVFMEHATNPGMGEVMKVKTGENNPNAVQIVMLDNFARERGWFESRPDIAVFKVDVEGNEYQVIEGAKELLKSKMIRNIFMEISVREPHERNQNIPMLTFLGLEANYKLHAVGSWPGPGRPVNWPNDKQLVKKIQDEAAAEGAKQLNLWWKVTP